MNLRKDIKIYLWQSINGNLEKTKFLQKLLSANAFLEDMT